jgi:Transposase
MSARLSGAPGLLIELCARSLVTDTSAGCSAGPAGSNCPSMTGGVRDDSNDCWGRDRHRQTHHWICAVDSDGRALVSVKVANVSADLLAALPKVTDLADQVVWAIDIIGAPSALMLALLARAGSPVY